MEALRLHDKVALCCSSASLGSAWVEREIELAHTREMQEDRILLLPLNLDGFLFEGYDGRYRDDLRGRLAADFNGWKTDNDRFEAEFARVVTALRTDPAARETPPEPRL